MKIGLISDTHIPINASVLPPLLAEVFDGVELILHAGDIYLPWVLDELEKLAPVLAAYGDGDERMRVKIDSHPSLKKSHVVQVDGMRIGLAHNPVLSGAPLEKTFGSQVDLVVVGHTHRVTIDTCQGIPVINPGSATLPDHQERKKGTVVLLEIEGGEAKPKVIQLG